VLCMSKSVCWHVRDPDRGVIRTEAHSPISLLVNALYCLMTKWLQDRKRVRARGQEEQVVSLLEYAASVEWSDPDRLGQEHSLSDK
jgi:hypothetical protein